jgi:hypothetical protein
VLATAPEGKVRVALNELGYGPPYAPEYADITGSGYCAIILPSMDGYPKRPPLQARVFLFDPTTRAFRLKVVPWSNRFHHAGTKM